MKKITRKLLVSILAVALAVIALGTSTYAWFTLGGTVSTEQVTAQIDAGDGIEISLDGNTWYNTLPASVINTALANLSMKDVSTTDGKTMMKYSTSTADGEAATFSGAAKDYLQLNLQFRSVTASQNIGLTAFDAQSSTVAWVSDVTLSAQGTAGTNGGYAALTAGNAANFNAVNALRMSIVADPGSGETITVYDPADVTTSSARLNGDVFSTGTKTTAGLTHDYAVAKGITDFTNYPAYPGALATQTDLSGNTVHFATAATQTGGYYVVPVTLNVWLEGWDGDCINAILNQQINLSFTFTAY